MNEMHSTITGLDREPNDKETKITLPDQNYAYIKTTALKMYFIDLEATLDFRVYKVKNNKTSPHYVIFENISVYKNLSTLHHKILQHFLKPFNGIAVEKHKSRKFNIKQNYELYGDTLPMFFEATSFNYYNCYMCQDHMFKVVVYKGELYMHGPHIINHDCTNINTNK